MSLSYYQENDLRVIESSLRWSDQYLNTKFEVFGRLYAGLSMPPWEQMPSERDDFHQPAWIVTMLIAVAAALSALLAAALIPVVGTRRAGVRPHPKPDHTGHRREAGDGQDPP
jgi:hypothetical protein